MATKTISLDMEAYRRLRAVRRPDESFSGVIKRVVRKPIDIDDYLYRIEGSTMAAKAAEAVREHVSRRHAPSRRRR